MLRVLIVDDHRNTREALQIGLATSGISADTAASAAEALVLAARTRYDAAICDVRMPGVDGIALGTRLRARDAVLRLLFMTAYEVGPAEDGVVARLDGRLLIKPVTAATVAAALGVGARQPTAPSSKTDPKGISGS